MAAFGCIVFWESICPRGFRRWREKYRGQDSAAARRLPSRRCRWQLANARDWMLKNEYKM